MGYLLNMQISVQTSGANETTLVISGELDVATATDLRSAGEQALADGSPTLIVDLEAVTFLDSSGLGALIALRNASLAAERSFSLRRPSPRVNKVLELSGLTDVFDVAG
jgi:anti-sigma B factor antagonist